MFGKEFANHINILTQSFQEMNDIYKKKLDAEKKSSSLLYRLKKYYILLFGIPEIGFQIRSIYFKKVISSFIPIENLKKVLDAGSGIGAYTFWLARKFAKARVVGGDIDKSKLKTSELIKRHIQQENLSFMYFDVTRGQNKSRYDLITAIDVLEHIKNYKLALRNFYTLLHKNGYLYIHVPQPNQQRIFTSLKTWHHQDHVHDGIDKQTLENILEEIGFKIIVAQETFGLFGKFAWEINHLLLSNNFILAGIAFPLLYPLAILDAVYKNKNGLGIAVLAQKKQL